MTFEQEVEHLFDTADDRHEKRRRNPVTGAEFVRGLDPIPKQNRIAVKALKARAWFASQRPPDAPELPLTKEDREAIKVGTSATSPRCSPALWRCVTTKPRGTPASRSTRAV
jgi:hypothetical protein